MICDQKRRVALSPNPSPTHQRPPRLRLCGSAKTRGFPHDCLHSLPTTTTANPSSHQPSKWPRNAPVSLLAPTVATYVHPPSPLPASSPSFGLFASSFFPGRFEPRVPRQIVASTSNKNRWITRGLSLCATRPRLRKSADMSVENCGGGKFEDCRLFRRALGKMANGKTHSST